MEAGEQKRADSKREDDLEPSALLQKIQSAVESLREQREAHADRSHFVRIAYALAGITVLVAGIAMLALPGPALIVIPLGLAMLSLEFAWAERMLDGALDRAARADRAAQSPEERRLIIIAAVLAAAALVAWALIGDIPLLPV
jgi:uncharacterized protein (TIGR02611 family)